MKLTHASHPLDVLKSREGYRRHFMDLDIWQPKVEEICCEFNWDCSLVIPGTAGTFPTFIVDEQRVIKFFGPMFNGETCWRVEQECGRLTREVPGNKTVRLLAAGCLVTEPAWHYLVFEYIPGVNIGKVYAEVSEEDKISLAKWLGGFLNHMHHVAIPKPTSLPSFGTELAYIWFSMRLQQGLDQWPIHLASQVEPYLSTNFEFIQEDHASFIHADLTQDHILGRIESGRWNTLAIIDFGDAMCGNIYYELTALHLDLFDCDKHLLQVFMNSYGFHRDKDFVTKVMVTSLVHQFDVYSPLFSWRPELREMRTLDEMADHLWNLDN